MKGLVLNMSDADYHARKEVSATWLKTLRKSPAHLRALIDFPRKETKALAAGKLIHTAVLEPDLLPRRYAACPKVDKRTTAGKATWEGVVAANPGKVIITVDEMKAAEAIRDKAFRHPSLKEVMRESGKAEVSAFGIEPVVDVPVRARFDWLAGATIADIKTTTDAADYPFARDMAKYGYHLQAAHYMAVAALCGRPIDHFLFIVVEKERPFELNVRRLGVLSLARGHELRDRLLDRFKECSDANVWPGYDVAIKNIEIPRYALKDETDAGVFFDPDAEDASQ